MAGPFQPNAFQQGAFQTEPAGELSADPATYSISGFDVTFVTVTPEISLMNSRIIFVLP